MEILLIDEKDCFAPIRHLCENLTIDLLQPEYFIAPNPSFFNKMIEASSNCDIVVIHRKIWTDECDENDTCTRLTEFEQSIKPKPVLRVGTSGSSHESCPCELLYVFNQLFMGVARLGKLIGAKVIFPKGNIGIIPHTISKLEIIGENVIGCVLKSHDGENKKYYRLADLQLAIE